MAHAWSSGSIARLFVGLLACSLVHFLADLWPCSVARLLARSLAVFKAILRTSPVVHVLSFACSVGLLGWLAWWWFGRPARPGYGKTLCKSKQASERAGSKQKGEQATQLVKQASMQAARTAESHGPATGQPRTSQPASVHSQPPSQGINNCGALASRCWQVLRARRAQPSLGDLLAQQFLANVSGEASDKTSCGELSSWRLLRGLSGDMPQSCLRRAVCSGHT